MKESKQQQSSVQKTSLKVSLATWLSRTHCPLFYSDYDDDGDVDDDDVCPSFSERINDIMGDVFTCS